MGLRAAGVLLAGGLLLAAAVVALVSGESPEAVVRAPVAAPQLATVPAPVVGHEPVSVAESESVSEPEPEPVRDPEPAPAPAREPQPSPEENVLPPAARTGSVLSSRAARSYPLPGGGGAVRIVLEGAPEAAVSVLQLRSGAVVPEHTHTVAEVLYLEAGTVRVFLDGAARNAVAGDVIYIPAGVRHSAHVPPRASARAVQVYVPPGPEQRFKQPPRGR